LTHRCQIGDNQGNNVYSLIKRPQIHIYCDTDLANGLPLQRQLYRMRRQALSEKHSRTARLKKNQHYGNSSSVPVGFLEICSKPSH
jgi:hypothetical protein